MKTRTTAIGSVLGILLAVSPLAPGQQRDDIFLMPGPTMILPADGKLRLGVVVLKPDGSIQDIAYSAYPGWKWSVNGSDPSVLAPAEGILQTGIPFTTADYIAPHAVPKTNPVTVAISYQPIPTEKTRITLVCNITIVDRSNFFQLGGKDAPQGRFELNERYSAAGTISMLERAMIAGPETMVTVGAMEPGGAGGGVKTHSSGTMNLTIAGAAPGDYKWTLPGSSATTVMLMIAGGSGEDLYSTGDCLPHGVADCRSKSTEGATRIISYDKSTGQVTGEFQGTVVKLVNGQPSSYSSVFGSFRVSLQQLGITPR